MNTKDLKRAIARLLDSQPDNARLRDNFEGLAQDPGFAALTWHWGPVLYARSRAIFRPFILANFSHTVWMPEQRKWQYHAWAEHAEQLEPWLAAARASRDVVLVRRLLQWKYAGKRGWDIDHERWLSGVMEAYCTAPSPAARAIVLDEFDLWVQLDEPTAIALYGTDRGAVPFILKHLPRSYWSNEKRVMWDALGQKARAAGDEAFYYSLYRQLIPADRWAAEIESLADAITDPPELCAALEQHHPEGWGIDRAKPMLALLRKRGRDVVPYIRAKLQDSFGGWYARGAEQKLAELAETQGWWDVWAAAIRVSSGSKLFNGAIGKLMNDGALSDDARRERLKALAGASREWNWPGFGLATVHEIDDNLAVRVYRHYPDLIAGPLLPNVMPRWWSARAKLLAAAQQAGDDDLVDRLASRYATRVSWQRAWGNAGAKEDENEETARSLAVYYQDIRDRNPDLFARRAANLLTRIPAYATHNQNALLKHNDLARLVFVRSFDAFLGVPEAVRDLVEGSNIHVMMLAYRVLARPDPRAITLAAANLDILIGTLLRPIHRKTRLAAFDALANAARAGEEPARLILHRARDALTLPDKKYPKDELIGLIARVLAAQPVLAGPWETPLIYRNGRAA